MASALNLPPDDGGQEPSLNQLPANQKIDIEKGKSRIIWMHNLFETREAVSRSLELMTHDGWPLLRLNRNPDGNQGEKSYTAIFPNGYKLLLPVPFGNPFKDGLEIGRSNFAHMLGASREHVSPDHLFIQINSLGNLRITDMNSDSGTSFMISEEEKIDENEDSEQIMIQELTPEWKSLYFRPNEYLTLYGKDGPLGYIFKLPQQNGEYVFRKHPDGPPGYLKDGELNIQSELFGAECNLLVNGSRIQLRGSKDIGVSLTMQPIVKKVPLGKNGHIEAFINGGRKVAGVTLRETDGAIYSKYPALNGDSMAVNTETGVIVQVDGVGQPGNESNAAALAAEGVASYKGSLHEALVDAHVRLDCFNWYYNTYQKSDAVLTALKIEGDELDPAVIGDSKWYVIRDRKIIARSREHSKVGEQYEAGLLGEQHPQGTLTLYEKLISPERATVMTTLLFNFVPDCTYILNDNGKLSVGTGKIKLRPGDRVLQMSDGGDALTDEEIIEAVSAKDPAEGVCDLLEVVESKNQKVTYPRDCYDGKGPQGIFPPWDNVTFVMYGHD